ncbi:MAG: SDR family NAD(P)-dependent oxidoreductase [Acidimicrobiales bacterium]
MTGRLEGKVAVVTGASNGIGRACATRFAAEGAAVVVADVQEAPGAAVVSSIEEAGGRAAFVRLDAASAAANEEAMALAVDRFGGLHVLVTAAGVSRGGYVSGDHEASLKAMRERLERPDPALAITELDLDNFREVLEINLIGTLLAVRAAAAHMVAAGGGSIVTIASIAAVDPLFGDPAYPVSKAGVWMLTKAAARSLAGAGVRVNAIGPGFIETNMTSVLDELEPMRNLVLAQTPMRRKGRPEEVANLALFLATDEASYVTGELIHPDGGWFTG